MTLHHTLGPESRHPVPSRIYADGSARLADTNFSVDDEGLFAWQMDEDSLWMLSSSELSSWVMVAAPYLANINNIQFNTDITPTAEHTPGLVEINPDTGSLDVHSMISGVVLQVGHELLMIARNDTGNDIGDGKAVYYSGVLGAVPTIGLANASYPWAQSTIGVTTHYFPKNTLGLVAIFGAVRNIDTSPYPEGAKLFVSSTSSGDFQITQPPAPLDSIVVGVVLRSHPTLGMIGVRIRIIQRLSYLSDVDIRGADLDDYDFIKWHENSETWGKRSLPWLVDDLDPTGFDRGPGSYGDDSIDGVIDFDNATRIFSISPVGESFYFYVKGKRYFKYTQESVEISAEEGSHYIYFDDTGTLLSTTSFSEEIITSHAFVAYIYWDSDNSRQIILSDERHGYRFPGTLHLYLHNSIGAVYNKGLDPTNLVVDGSGSSNSSIQFGYDTGNVADEDISKIIQIFNSPASIPIFYRSGLGLWRRKDSDAFPLIYSGTAGYSGTLIPYNAFDGLNWTLEPCTNNEYIVMMYFACFDINYSVFGLQGQNVYGNISQARLGVKAELENTVKDGFPFLEFVACWAMIVQASSSFANTPKAIFRTLDDGNAFLDMRKIRGVPII